MKNIALIGLLCCLSFTGFRADERVTVRNCLLEQLPDPLGIDALSPRFSWELSSAVRGTVQTAYRLVVASTPGRLDAGPDVALAVKNAKAGQVRYRTDKNGIIHTSVGKIGFEAGKLKENVEALIADLKRIKPASSKGIYVKRVTLSTTMGPGLVIDQSSLNV